MNTKLRMSLTAGALAVGLGAAGTVSASLSPNLSFSDGAFTFGFECGEGFSCIMGEGAAPNTNIDPASAPASVQYVDWMIVYDDTDSSGGDRDDFYYFYQVENSAAGPLDRAGISGQNLSTPGVFQGWADALGATSLGGCDFDDANWLDNCDNNNPSQFSAELDLTALTSGGFTQPGHVIAGEVNDALSGDLVEDNFDEPAFMQFSSLVANWLGSGGFSKPSPNEESGIFGARGTAPTYVTFTASGNAAGGTTGSEQVWRSDSSFTAFNRNVAGPGMVPEPTTMALAGLALLGAGFVGRRRRNS